MSFALIRSADGFWLSGPFDEAPAPAEGEEAVPVALGYPTTVEWSPSRRGFVDIVVATPSLISVGRFKLLFTFEERAALRAAAANNPVVDDFLDLLAGFTEGVWLADPVLVNAIEHLKDGGLVSADRAAAILAGTPPA